MTESDKARAGAVFMEAAEIKGSLPSSKSFGSIAHLANAKKKEENASSVHETGRCAPVRRLAAKVVQHPWFDWFILFLIGVNTILLMFYQYTCYEDCHFNWYADEVIDPILLAFFTGECLLKITAWGLICRVRSNTIPYLCDTWNWLDFIVVVTGWFTMFAGDGDGLSFLRLFRVLRPLRSLTMVPEMRDYVCTVLNSIRGLIDVMLMAIFIFTVFAIIGITLWGGIFFRRCRTTPNPVLSASGQCWVWEASEEEPRLCGGRYECPSGSWCGGHPDDLVEDYRPVFPGGSALGLTWCDNGKDINNPKKTFPETDFIHFDHFGGALLIVFQSMTMEGWIDILYVVQDGTGILAATIYFIMVILITSFFVLNVILAVISESYTDLEQEQADEAKRAKADDEARGLRKSQSQQSLKSGNSEPPKCQDLSIEDLPVPCGDEPQRLDVETPTVEALAKQNSAARASTDTDRAKEALQYLAQDSMQASVGGAWVDAPSADGGNQPEDELWFNCCLVRFCYNLSEHEFFRGIVLFFIVANVVVMLLEKWPPDLHLKDFMEVSQLIFTIAFAVEMVIMLIGLGPKKYVTTPLTAFDGIIVLGSFVEFMIAGEGGSALTVLRIFRLFRVVVKMSSGVPAFGLLVRSMVHTVFSLGYFAILFVLVLLVCTLMGMQFFATRFHFNADGDGVLDQGRDDDPVRVFCVGDGYVHSDMNKDCIPRANFDTFIEGFTTIFQIMSGENWNTVMYDAMRAKGWLVGSIFFVFLILFGQTLMLNLFLTILMAKFEDASESLKQEEREKKLAKKIKKRQSFHSGGLHSEMKKRMSRGLTSGSNSFISLPAADGDFSTPTKEIGRSTSVEDEMLLADSDSCLRRQANPPPEHGHDMPTVDAAWLPGQTGDLQHPPLPPTEVDEEVVEFPKQVEDPTSPPQPSNGDDDIEDVTFLEAKMDMRKVEFQPQAPSSRAISSDDVSMPTSSPTMMSTFTSFKKEKVYPDCWPYTYALLVFHRDNIIRVFFLRIVSHPFFDWGILVCILLSSLCMAVDSPLDDPSDTHKVVLKVLDLLFSVIFIVEMLMKLVCFGLLFFSPKSYLRNGWNILDGGVVIVSLIDMLSSSSTGFLKTLRILRAFRPLRVIARAETLKVVVTTIFRSLPELVTLVFVSIIFLLIVAIVLLQYLNGRFYACFIDGDGPVNPGGANFGPALEGSYGNWRTPLCVGSNDTTVSAAGVWDGIAWNHSNCSAPLVAWKRPSADTPMCIGRCNKGNKWTVHGLPPEALCPRQLTRAQELPSVCPAGEMNLEPQLGSPYYADELRGSLYVKSQLRDWVLPCGAPKDLSGVQVATSSCRDMFCPERGHVDSCHRDCKNHPDFCIDACKTGNENTQECSRCREQCQAWCECEDYCEPVSREAAICVEQGGKWGPVISQNFNTILNSMLTLFELTTTEGWVDVMYAAVDARHSPYFMTPLRGRNTVLWSIVFIVYIFLSNMFLINLSVGVIVENFITIKKESGSVALTPAQERWVISQRSLYERACLFQLTNLHHKPKMQRQMFNFISSPCFENTIMTAIVLNTLLMACNAFPLPFDWWDTFLLSCNYFFAGVFFFEFVFKLYALRVNYWKDYWNLFDFFCVMATFVGIIVKVSSDANIGSVMSVIRIFRIARLFRLLRFMKGLNKIFMALVFSVPKLLNVIGLLVLLLFLYSVLGVQLFATVKHSDTFNQYGNFSNFFWAFLTLFRSMTGEAWNEIMHDLSKGEYQFSREGTWCSPKSLFDTEIADDFAVLRDKCLIQFPNRCGDNPLVTKLYFVSYTVVITFTVLNLVIAVILEGYEDGKEHTEAEVIDTCTRVWRKYDHDLTMFLDFKDVFHYVDEVLRLFELDDADQIESPTLKASNSGVFGMDLSCVPMRYANDFDLTITSDGKVHFMHVVKMVLHVVVSENNPKLKEELKESHDKMSERERNKLLLLETKQMHKNRAVLSHSMSLRSQVAASKIQRRFKKRRGMNLAEKIESLPRRASQNDHDHLTAESFSDTNGRSSPDPGVDTSHRTEASFTQEHLEPRSPANVDGLDVPGRTKIVSVTPPAEAERPDQDRPCPRTDQAPPLWADGSGIHQPPPGG